ncbi:MAG: PH domain-containing protein [Alphaproteobacteria bacterium]|nr:PH domain-containing protein [Alphaproteobacteria bacterium]
MSEDGQKISEKKEAPKQRPQQKKRVAPMKTFLEQEIDRVLVSDEEVILKAELHNAIYWKSFAVIFLAILVFFYAPPLGTLLAVVGIIMLFLAILTQHFLLLAVTNKRVLARYGLLQMDVIDIRLSKIESIDLERMLPGHIFGYASVVVMGTGRRVIRVPYIRNADAFRQYYNEMALAEEGNEEAEEEIRKDKEAREDEAEQKKRKKSDKR